VLFSSKHDHKLYFYNKNKLYEANLESGNIAAVETFENDVVSLFNYEKEILVATTNHIFNLADSTEAMYSLDLNFTSKIIINAFTKPTKSQRDTSDSEPNTGLLHVFVTVGSRWNIKLHELVFEGMLHVDTLATKTVFDTNLPHRGHQKKLTKFLGISHLNDALYVSDYW
jgi:hypothetical protein